MKNEEFSVPIRNQEHHVTLFYNDHGVAVGAYQIHRIAYDPTKLQFIQFSEN